MHMSILTGAAATAVVFAVLIDPSSNTSTRAGTDATPPTQSTPVAPTRADGHYVLVVEGDRLGLDITFASRKQAPWAGIPTGFSSTWHLTVLDATGTTLTTIPLDVRPFATDPCPKIHLEV